MSGIGYFQHNIYTVDISAIVMALAILISGGILLDVNASGLGESDFPEHPEAYCILDEENPLCENVDICDDEGEITSEDQFCYR